VTPRVLPFIRDFKIYIYLFINILPHETLQW